MCALVGNGPQLISLSTALRLLPLSALLLCVLCVCLLKPHVRLIIAAAVCFIPPELHVFRTAEHGCDPSTSE